MKLCILGMGSKDCKALEKRIIQILNELGIDSAITMSDDIDLFIKHNIDRTPALLIDDYLIHNQELQVNGLIRKHIIEHINQHDKNHKAS